MYHKKKRYRWLLQGGCAIMLIAVMLFGMLTVSFSRQLEDTELSVKPQDYFGVVVPLFSYERGGQFRAFQEGSYEAFSIVKAVEIRHLAAAYSPSLKPLHVWHREEAESVRAAQEMPTDFFIGVIACDDMLYEEVVYAETPMLTGEYVHTFRYGYSCHLQEALCISSPEAAQKNISIELSFYQEDMPQPPMQKGKSYLIWGKLIAYEDGNAQLQPLKQSSRYHSLLVRHEEYTDIRIESAVDTGIMVPLISEINMPLEEFWQTDTGKQWQDDILPKGEIQHHSVKIVGTSDVETVISFHRGSSYVTEGVAPNVASDADACLVSEALAEKNGWSIGDQITLSVYDNTNSRYYHRTYDPYVGFSEEHTYRICGLYRTEDDLYDVHAVHPNTVYVNPASFSRDYSGFQGEIPISQTDRNQYSESATVLDERYALIIPADATELFFTEARVLGYPAKYFLFDDGGYAEHARQYGTADQALQEAKSSNGSKARPSLALSAVIGLICLWGIMWGGKDHVDRHGAADAPRNRIFGYLLLRQGVVVAVAAFLNTLLTAGLYRLFCRQWLSRALSISRVEELLEVLPEKADLTAAIVPILLLYGLIAILMAYLGTWRRYHYYYHDEEAEHADTV